ncbi:uncharacterized protein LOC131929828 isoform X2 [Physella acuta]|nr:uncharacterized protein LOC131929828 isoform X2 [Physella acuta]
MKLLTSFTLIVLTAFVAMVVSKPAPTTTASKAAKATTKLTTCQKLYIECEAIGKGIVKSTADADCNDASKFENCLDKYKKDCSTEKTIIAAFDQAKIELKKGIAECKELKKAETESQAT